MPDITYKKFSELTQTTTLVNNDLFPIAQYISGIDYNSKSVTFQTLYNQTSGVLITPFTTSIQATINSTLSSDKWNSTYSTVQSNSATWGATVTDTLTAFSQGNTSTIVGDPMTVRFLSAGPIANASVAFIATGNGATLAQLPDNGIGGGNARGAFATDWQKARNDAAQVTSGNYSVIGGGERNKTTTSYSTVGGGRTNSITDTSTHGSIGGGLQNTLSGDAVYGVIAGGYYNTCNNVGASVLGGEGNRALSAYATVVGGYYNTASGAYGVVGGLTNTASGNFAVVAGGISNVASGSSSSIVGGALNNTNNKHNAHIIGSNITAPLSNFTYVNNISSQGDVRASRFIRRSRYTTSISTTIGVGLVSGEVHFIKGNFTGSTTIEIYNMEDVGSQITIYLENTGATARTITPKIAIEISPGFYTLLSLDMASSSTAGAAGVNSFSLAANGIAVITVNNVGGNTYPYGYYIGSVV